ncbi:MAG: hypothetical protein LBN27_06755 [Prevotellaceae bacterium]|nr:hypothetical protein [Prevotellaceae bacterium]
MAEETLGNYYENYQDFLYDNDLKIRVLNYRRIKEYLLSFDAEDTYEIDGKKFIKINGVCIVEFVKRDNGNEIYVENIYFAE